MIPGYWGWSPMATSAAAAATTPAGPAPAFLVPSNLPVEVEGNPLEQYSTRELAEEIFRRLPN